MSRFYDAVKERMLRYARIDSQSGTVTGPGPSTMCQKDMATELFAELKRLGVPDIFYDESACVVYAHIPASPGVTAEPVAFITHMDTAPDVSGHGVHPWVLEAYDGGDILLNREKGIMMKAEEHPMLKQYVGQDLILTDGTTLLGGDDKAAIAAVMTLAEVLLTQPDFPHGPVSLAFTPDEEVGGLARELDLERLGARFAYTLDGDHVGWYQDQTFNAAAAALDIHGISVHTGTAKGLMVNASDLAVEFLYMLPLKEKPQFTSGVEGFYHVCSISSSCEHAHIELIIRDFDEDGYAARLEFLGSCAEELNRRYGQGSAALTVTEQYLNMGQILSRYPFLTDLLQRAITDCGLEPVCEPFRGGTDGAALTFRGLPCPNLSAGYENAHGRFEFVPIQSMEKNVEILLALCRRWAERDEYLK